jgi:hypothetical protein
MKITANKSFFLYLILYYVCTIISIRASAEINPDSLRVVHTVCYYSFMGATSQQQVDSLSTDVYQIPEVIQFKARFKPENSQAEITVTVVEYFPDPESQQTFDVARLKVILINHGFSPLVLTSYEQDH